MLKPSQIYLSSLLHMIHQHPLTKQEDFSAWDNVDAGNREKSAKELEAALLLAAPKHAFQFNSILANGELKALFAYLGKEIPANWYFNLQSSKSIGAPKQLKPDKNLEAWQNGLRNDLANTPIHFTPEKAAEQLLFVLEKNCVALPSGYHEAVSFYDFAKIFAATAICKNVSVEQVPFLLICGGLSGIQDYLYDIVSRKASRNLKGRSFYLQLLAETVMMETLDVLELYRVNVVFASGSKFMILAPNSPENVKKLYGFKKSLSKRLFEEFKTRISLDLDWKEMSDLELGTIGTTYQSINEQKGKNKQRKFSEIMCLSEKEGVETDERNKKVSGYEYFFEPLEITGEEERDAITNEEIFGVSEKIDQWDINSGDVKLGTQTQIKLGGILTNNDNEVIVSGKLLLGAEKWHKINISKSEINHYFFKKNTLKNKSQSEIEKGFIQHFGNSDWQFDKDIPAVQGFTFYTGNKVPCYTEDILVDSYESINGEQVKVGQEILYEKDSPKTFEDLADDGQTRFKRLGFLRMDIDGLGNAFSSIFNKRENQNPHFPQMLAAYSALSRNLDYFMKGRVNEIWAIKEGFNKYIQIIYSGGDDLFIVGKWDSVLEMAEKIRTDFNEWICFYPGLSISGGIELVTSKFPTIKAAGSAANMEDLAKAHIYEDKKSNAITLFKYPLEWDTEYRAVKELKDIMTKLSNDNILPRGFFTKIQGLYEQALFQKMEHKTEAWRWRIAYDFAKMKERKKNNIELNDFLDEMKNGIITGRANQLKYSDPFRYFNLIRLAANWADFETRL